MYGLSVIIKEVIIKMVAIDLIKLFIELIMESDKFGSRDEKDKIIKELRKELKDRKKNN